MKYAITYKRKGDTDQKEITTFVEAEYDASQAWATFYNEYVQVNHAYPEFVRIETLEAWKANHPLPDGAGE